ncbi:ABC transporter ATP-binding protein [Stakelama saccharophila]|uniref:Sn-glycerol-3-phosphate ABC transporter ATP-binding protein UgpC n=1 Tax=Stakelama saccharophila TaxID=3075605 RepID=A0ABZ0B4X9_9SPHN|nr:sn-glycerol-3-phosphate ABC transporter ATP-binding protein UgpC [Stakelama sp. W311]WNO52353.1 sn-glycerol-3-phosphate ABC transporter ATP-binding protein UgpC [Stakelama sp. W311]
MSGVTLAQVSKSYGSLRVVDRLSLEIAPGEFVVFLGPSGCGKSTLLRMIAGLETVDSGAIHIGDARVDHLPPGKRGVAMVFQHYALYPHMTVRENMAFGLRNAGVDKAEITRRAEAAAESLEISALLDRKPGQLSGGQRQRVAIARAIVKEPALFLLDEPLSNLDAALRNRTRLEIAQLHQRLGATMIFVTHDQVEAMTLADRIVILNGGGIEQVGTPMEIYLRPRTQFVATFVGSPRINLLPAAMDDAEAGHAIVRLGDGTRVVTKIAAESLDNADNMNLGIRPECVRPVPMERAVMQGKAAVVERLGERTLVHVTLSDGETLVAEDAGVSSIRVGDVVGVSLDTDAAHLFDAHGLGHHPEGAG